MEIKLVSAESNGFHDFDISGAGTIYRATVSNEIKNGEIFNIYYGNSGYVPYHGIQHRKQGGTWRGKKGIGGYLVGDLEKSICKSEVFIAESANSEKFYSHIEKKYKKCDCADLHFGKTSTRKVIAVDLAYPEYQRQSKRSIVLLGNCRECAKPLPYGHGFGECWSNGLDNLKRLAESEARQEIQWDAIITSIDDVEKSTINNHPTL
mgnify:CR=1 FL=1